MLCTMLHIHVHVQRYLHMFVHLTLSHTLILTHLADGCSSSRRLLVADGCTSITRLLVAGAMSTPTALLMKSVSEHLEGLSVASKVGVVECCIVW